MPVIGREAEHWRCYCDTRHDAAVLQRCPECGDYAPGYHFRPTPKPWWWDNPAIRENVANRKASNHPRPITRSMET